jgi:cytochrome c-type biogenesis protein CcmE
MVFLILIFSIKRRVGGYLKKGSTQIVDNEKYIFTISDHEKEIKVEYKGVLPALFQETQIVIAEGKFKDNCLIASQVLAKHDENYKPKNLIK